MSLTLSCVQDQIACLQAIVDNLLVENLPHLSPFHCSIIKFHAWLLQIDFKQCYSVNVFWFKNSWWVKLDEWFFYIDAVSFVPLYFKTVFVRMCTEIQYLIRLVWKWIFMLYFYFNFLKWMTGRHSAKEGPITCECYMKMECDEYLG